MLTAFLLICAFQPESEIWYGPFRIADRNPLQNAFLTPAADRADLLSTDAWKLELQMAFSNVFERASNETWFQEFDMERLTPGFTLRRGFGDRWEAGLSWGAESTFGGETDGLIQDYHNALGFPNDSREEVPDGAYRYRLVREDGSGVIFDHPKQSLEPDDAVLFVKRRFRKTANAESAFRFLAKMPVGNDAVSSGGVDLGVAFDYHRGFGRFHAHFTLAGAWYGDAGVLEPFVRAGSVTASGALERRMNGPWSLMIQLDLGTTPFEGTGLSTLEDPPVNFTFGAAGDLGAWQWQASFAEDLTGGGPAVDFTLDLQISRRF